MQFIVDAYREPEGLIRLEVAADSAARASEIASGDGYDVLEVRGGTRAKLRFGLGPRNTFSIPHFSRELVMLLEAGLGIVEIVDLLQRKSRDATSRAVLESLHASLRHGKTLSVAMESRPDVFSPLFIATVRSSERTSNLVEALKRYLAYHDKMSALKAKIVSASIYPAIVLCAGGLVVVFLMTYVVPRFAKIYEGIGGDLPLLSRLLMGWGQLFEHHALLIAAALAAIISAGVYGVSSERLRKRLLFAIWRWPAVGEKLRLYELSRLAQTLGMLIRGGIPAATALNMTGELLSQPALKGALALASREVREGTAMSVAFERHGLATLIGVRLLVVGEKSGTLAEALERISTLYDAEISEWVEWFSRIFEPVLMAVIGLIIGGIVLLMYMPIFELASSIQ